MSKKIKGYFTGTVAGVVIVTVIFLMICLFPFLLLWSLNALTGNDVEFTVRPWVAGFIILLLFRTSVD